MPKGSAATYLRTAQIGQGRCPQGSRATRGHGDPIPNVARSLRICSASAAFPAERQSDAIPIRGRGL